MVCLGNICRSPMGEGALRQRLVQSGLDDQVQVDSAGTGGWHRGEPPDSRAVRCASGHGVDISGLRARQVRAEDFRHFDWLLCADPENEEELLSRAPDDEARARVSLWLPWAGVSERLDIPDPYMGGAAEFEEAWELVDRAAKLTVRRLSHDPALGIIGT